MIRDCVVLSLLLIVLVPSCGDGGDDGAASAAPRRPAGPPVVVEASVEDATVDIGAKVVYTVRVRFDAGIEVDLPPVLEQFENAVVDDFGFWIDLPDSGTKRVKEISITLDPGIGPILEIPPSTIRWREQGAEGWEEETTEAIIVEVVSVTEGLPELREPLDPIEPPVEMARSEARSSRTALIVTGAAGVLLLVLWWFLLRQRREPVVPVLPAHEVAQRELGHLESLGLLEGGRVQEYYYRLTAILRRYIELRFEIMAPERTTEEFLVEMRGSATLPGDQKAVLAEFLASADLVKYARHEPPTDEARRAFDVAERFVKMTIASPGHRAETETADAV